MAEPAKPVHRRIESLREAFQKELPNLVEELSDLLRRALAPDAGQEALQVVRDAAAAIGDRSAELAISDVNVVARSIQLLIDGLLPRPRPLPSDLVSQVEGLTGQLRRIAIRAEAEPVAGIRKEQEAPAPHADHGPRPVLMLAREDAERDLTAGVAHHGYTLQAFQRLGALRHACRSGPAAAVLVDILYPEGQLLAPEVLDDIRRACADATPVFFVSERSDLAARLHAARLGGAGFFTYPVDVPALMDALESHTVTRASGLLRVLIVDRSQAEAIAHLRIVDSAGMLGEIVADPEELMDQLARFKPDLVLMDEDVPGAGGVHLGTVIRHQPEHVGTPLLLLSRRPDAARILAGSPLGADAALPADTPADELLLTLTSWAKRYRTLRSLMGRDTLTSLRSRRGILDHLEIELARAYRSLEPLAFVRMDIDGLQRVNEEHGVVAGDEVIRGLGRLLKKRLRRTDISARYTGGRFGLILPNTNDIHAPRVVEELRRTFEAARHKGPWGEVGATFSAGVAVYPHYSDALALQEAADRALSEAKELGGNRVATRTERGKKGRRVLVVEDDAHQAEVYQMVLERAGYEAITAHDGTRALDLARSERPDIVLSDVLIPGINGFDLCARIKQEEALAGIPVVLVTGVYRKYTYRIEAQKCGALELVEKPIANEKLVELVERHLRGGGGQAPAPRGAGTPAGGA